MIQKEDLKVGLHIITSSGDKGVIVSWEQPPSFTIPMLTMPPIRVTPPIHVLINTANNGITMITWGENATGLNVDLSYYNKN